MQHAYIYIDGVVSQRVGLFGFTRRIVLFFPYPDKVSMYPVFEYRMFSPCVSEDLVTILLGETVILCSSFLERVSTSRKLHGPKKRLPCPFCSRNLRGSTRLLRSWHLCHRGLLQFRNTKDGGCKLVFV